MRFSGNPSRWTLHQDLQQLTGGSQRMLGWDAECRGSGINADLIFAMKNLKSDKIFMKSFKLGN